MSETKGRCRSEVDECRGSPSELKIADAIDRLAADVAAVKAKVNDIMPEDVAHLVECEKAWVRLVEEKETAAIRERDEARAEVARLRGEVEDSDRLIDQLIVGNEALARERDEARAEVEKLRAELAARPADGNRQATLDSSLAARPAGNSPQIPDSLPADPPPAGWLTDEERHILSAHLQSLREQRRAMERGGQTLGYSANHCAIKREADVIDNLLARAGSPPVVGVPPFENYAPEVLHLRYRDAISRAGVKWKEVGRE